jgi:hypothetical protein
MQVRIFSSDWRINRHLRISPSTCFRHMLLWRKHPDIIPVLFAAFKEMCRTEYFTAEDVSCSDCVGINTDGAAASSGEKERPGVPRVNIANWVIHREALVTDDLESKLNFPTRSGESDELCKRSPIEHCDVTQAGKKPRFLHSQVRCVLKRSVELKGMWADYYMTLVVHCINFTFLYKKCLALLSYLPDISDKLNRITVHIRVQPVLSFLTRWQRIWLRHHATSCMIVGSVPDEVIGIFNLPEPSSCNMALESSLPLTEMSTRNITLGGGRGCRPAGQ